MRYFWSSASNYPTVGRLTKKWKTQFQYHGLAPIGLEFVGLLPVGVVVVGSLVWPATGPHRTNKKSSGIRKLYMNFSLKAVRDSAQSKKRTVRDISMQLRNVPFQHKLAWTEESSLCKKNHECLLTVRESHEWVKPNTVQDSAENYPGKRCVQRRAVRDSVESKLSADWDRAKFLGRQHWVFSFCLVKEIFFTLTRSN